MFYVDVQNVYNFKSDSPPEYTNLTPSGQENIDPADNTRYVLRELNPMSGTILPTLGIIIEF